MFDWFADKPTLILGNVITYLIIPSVNSVSINLLIVVVATTMFLFGKPNAVYTIQEGVYCISAILLLNKQWKEGNPSFIYMLIIALMLSYVKHFL